MHSRASGPARAAPIPFLSLLTVLAASPLPSQQPGVELVDRVEAIVGQTVILRSQVDREAWANFRARQRGGAELTQADYETLFRRALRRRIDIARRAESAKTLGTYSPDVIESLIEEEIQREEARQAERLGSYAEFGRELERQNRDWREHREMLRQSELQLWALQQVAIGRLGADTNLLFTPEEMQRYYHQNRERFVHGARADLGVVVLPDEETAREAARVWRAEDLAPAGMAERFDAVLARVERDFRGPPPGSDVAPDDPRRPFLRGFALENGPGTVSDPRKIGSNFWVLKVLRKQEETRRPFLDADVQDEIRQTLARRVREDLTDKLQRRSEARIQVWAPHLEDR